MRQICRSMVLLATLIAPLISYGATPEPQVKIASGIVEGKEVSGVRIFLGIPYAAPPVGELRWKPPVPPDPWMGVRKAVEFGSRCMQGRVYADMNFRDSGGSEDCLFINVWTPAKTSEARLPVMVWIYGGGFVAGSTSEPRQDGEQLARQGVVVVSMNYRLGIFGFLVHRELTKESGRNSAGNYGLLDQVAALKWVQQNIAAFGGDPANVTIFGESAGSFSVSALMASPLAKGYFERAIGESGAAFSTTGLTFEPRAVREQRDAELVNSTLGIRTLAELRAVPAQKLLDAFFKPEAAQNFAFGPDVDGYFLPESVPAIFAAGKQNDVPLLAGWNRDEGGLQAVSNLPEPSVDRLKANAEKEFGARAAEFLRLYPADTEAQALRSMEDFAGDRFIAWSTWRWIEAQSTTGKQPVYRYRFDLAPPADANGPQRGAFHSAEIEYVFGQLDSKVHVQWRPEDRRLSAHMQEYWANFARSGDPNGPGLQKWPRYSAADGWQVMHLDEKSEARKDEQRQRYIFLTAAWAK